MYGLHAWCIWSFQEYIDMSIQLIMTFGYNQDFE